MQAYLWKCIECGLFITPRDLLMFSDPPTVSCPSCESSCGSPVEIIVTWVYGGEIPSAPSIQISEGYRWG